MYSNIPLEYLVNAGNSWNNKTGYSVNAAKCTHIHFAHELLVPGGKHDKGSLNICVPEIRIY